MQTHMGLAWAMHRYELVGPILDAARRGGTSGRTLADILKEATRYDRIPDHTGAAIIGMALIALTTNNLIAIEHRQSPSDRSLVRAITKFKKSHDFSDGYAAAGLLRKYGEENILVRLTPTFFVIQEIFGFSVTDMVESGKDPSFRVRPVFGKPDAASSLATDVFVLMPFGAELRPVYDDHIKPTCENAGLSCRRADDFFRVGQIMRDIWSAIFLSNWIIADCTGRNANVFYEMGIAHTIGKRVIIITQNEADVPSDIRYIRFFKYEFNPRGMKRLEEVLMSTLTGDI